MHLVHGLLQTAHCFRPPTVRFSVLGYPQTPRTGTPSHQGGGQEEIKTSFSASPRPALFYILDSQTPTPGA